MGADLCGYMLIGPKTIEMPPREQLEERVAVLQQLALAYPEDVSVVEGIETWEEAAVHLGCDPSVLATHIESWLASCSDAAPLSALIAAEVESAAEEFMELWHQGRRDSTSRAIPGDPRNRVVRFAGERTWGDGPEPGSGWQIAETADALGLLPLFGVE